MGVTVIVVAYHGDRWLPACLASLARASTARLHLVLVANPGNTNQDTLALDAFDAERLRTPRPLGFAEANNHALIHASRLERAVLFLNQDTVGLPGWIDRCVACLDRGARRGAVSPLIRTYDGAAWDPSFVSCLGPGVDPEGLAVPDADGADWLETRHVTAAALVVRTEVLRQVGPFDPVFGSYYEDYDLCRRIREAGVEVGVCRRAVLHHYSGSTTEGRRRELLRMRQVIRNRLLYQLRASEQPRLARLLGHLAFHLPRNLGRGFLGTPSSQPPLVILKAHWDLLRMAGRVVSRRRDEAAWRRYLEAIAWPPQAAGTRMQEAG
jgi:GT2 family glycosyltransferase